MLAKLVPEAVPEGLSRVAEALSGRRARVEAKPLVVRGAWRGGAESDHGAADEVDGWR